jgi:DNA-binding winged helix-turn-helix (wHTH) protein/Tol biopolymer transport system component
MGPLESLPRKIQFGDFEIDLRTGDVARNGHKFLLQGQPFQILRILLDRPGELVTREELKKFLWPSDTFVDFDHSLNKAVNRLREALADSADKPRYIETLPRRGYRFIGSVESAQQTEATPSTPPRVPVRGSYNNSGNSIHPISEIASSSASRVDHPDGMPAPKYLIAFACGAILIVAAVLFAPRRQSRGTRPIGFDNLEITKLTDAGNVSTAAISPDGRYVAYARLLGEKQSLWLRQVATRSDVQILPPDLGNFVGLTFSRNGNYIYFVRSDAKDRGFRYLYSLPTLGGVPRKVITDVDSGVGFSSDGGRVAYLHNDPPQNTVELKVANADGSDPHSLALIHNASFATWGLPGPSWSPDGQTIAVSALLFGEHQRWVLYVVSATDGNVRELFSSDHGIGRPIWLPSGDNLLLPRYDVTSRHSQLWNISFPQGVPHRFTHDMSDYLTSLDLTQDGETLAAITGTVQSQVWTAPATQLMNGRVIGPREPPFFEVREMPDGRILAGADGQLWTMNQDGSGLSPFNNAGQAGWFSVCGQFVVFASSEGGSHFLTRVDLDGAHPFNLIRGNVWYSACSYDSKDVLYYNFEQPQKIWRIPIEGGSPVEIATVLGDAVEGHLVASPDGKLLAYVYNTFTTTTSTGRHLAVIPANGGAPLKVFEMP